MVLQVGGIPLKTVVPTCRYSLPMDDALAIRVLLEEDRTLLVLSGELDGYGASTLEPWLTGDVILDMADVTFLDSQGLRALARARRDCERLVIRNPSGVARRVLTIVAMLDLLE